METSHPISMMTLMTRTARLAGLVILCTMGQAILWSPDAPLTMKATIIALAALAFARLDAALLVLAAVAPFGYLLTSQLWSSQPTRGTEAFVLAVLAGGLARRWWRPSEKSPAAAPEAAAVWVLSGVVLASCLVQLAVFQVWQDFPGPLVSRLALFLARDYHGPPLDFRPWAAYPGFDFVVTTALWLEGLALAVLVANRVRERDGLARRLAIALALGGLGAVGLTSVEMVTAAEGPFAVIDRLVGNRWGGLTGKVNTAASYYVLVLPIAMGLAVGSKRTATLWGIAAGLLFIGLRLTGSRAGLTAFAAVLIGVGMVFLVYRGPRRLALKATSAGACDDPRPARGFDARGRPLGAARGRRRPGGDSLPAAVARRGLAHVGH